MIIFPDLSRVGRLGNALFQFAATCGIAHRRGTAPIFNADWIHRPYFSVPDELFADQADINQMLDEHGIHMQDCDELHHIRPRHRMYAQDVRLFASIMPRIREWLAPSSAAWGTLGQFGDFHSLPYPRLAVHVRRGDNVPGQDPGVADKQNYVILPGDHYYKEAIAVMRERYKPASVVAFSDEPGWCERNLDVDFVFHGQPRPKEHEPEYATAPVLDWIDLQLIAQCQYHIVTGSTYGIWGALLADTQGAMRCHPVYGPKLADIDESLLFPREWDRRSSI